MSREDDSKGDAFKGNIFRNIKIVDCGTGIAGSPRNTLFENVEISGTGKPIDLDSAENVHFRNVSDKGDNGPKPKPSSKYFGGWNPPKKD